MVRSGQAYLPMHWGKRFLGGRASAGTNTLMPGNFDAASRQPELKHAAVKVSAATLPWRLTAFAEVGEGALAGLAASLQDLHPGAAFVSVVPIGRERAGILVRAANAGAPAPDFLAKLDGLLSLDGEGVLCYDDPARGHARRIRLDGDRLVAARLSGEPGSISSGEWLREWLVGGRAVAEVRRMLLSPSRSAPQGFAAAGRVVCQCWNVSEPQIAAALGQFEGEPRERLNALGTLLKCGTSCGSCLPELRELAARAPQNAQADSKAA